MKNIFIREKVGVKEGVGWKLEIGTSVFRKEFEYYLAKYNSTKEEKDLIFVFIMLQIYVENFLHNKIRKLVNFEFSYDHNKKERWKKDCELKYISDLTDKKTGKILRLGKLSSLINFWCLQENKKVGKHKNAIEEKFKKITKIRNALIHGHEIYTSGSSEDDLRVTSETKEYLTDKNLKEIIIEVNDLSKNWNKLLDIFLKNARAIKSINMLYFEEIKK